MGEKLEDSKKKRGISYSVEEKIIILNVYKYFRRIYPEKSVSDAVRRAAEATGCAERTIYVFRKQEASPGGIRPRKRPSPRKGLIKTSRYFKYDGNVRMAIRNIIYDLMCREESTSLRTILKHVNNEPSLPNFSQTTLRRLIMEMGFCYEHRDKKSVLIEKVPVVLDTMDMSVNIEEIKLESKQEPL